MSGPRAGAEKDAKSMALAEQMIKFRQRLFASWIGLGLNGDSERAQKIRQCIHFQRMTQDVSQRHKEQLQAFKTQHKTLHDEGWIAESLLDWAQTQSAVLSYYNGAPRKVEDYFKEGHWAFGWLKKTEESLFELTVARYEASRNIPVLVGQHFQLTEARRKEFWNLAREHDGCTSTSFNNLAQYFTSHRPNSIDLKEAIFKRVRPRLEEYAAKSSSMNKGVLGLDDYRGATH